MEEKRCTRCGATKRVEDFMWHRHRENLRDCYCRPGRAAYKQEHYKKNRQRYITNAKVRQRLQIEERMVFLQAYLESHPCVDCGETDVIVLEFDHLGNKSFDISNGLRYRNWEAVLAEIEKCEVVSALPSSDHAPGAYRRSKWVPSDSQGRLFKSG